VNITGTVASEVPITATVPSGPTVVPVVWNTAAFSPTFQVDEDYIVMAFWTDYEGNILDTAARPLSSFWEDPQPSFAMSAADTTWDFGTAAQGTVLKRSFSSANTGSTDMLTYVNPAPGVTLSQQGSRSVGPADVTTYEITLDTSTLAVGAYDRTIEIRSSDPAAPAQMVHVVGTVTAWTPDTPVGAMQRPLDWSLTVSSGTPGQWVQFTHTLGPTPQTLHPVKVYNQAYTTLLGVGKTATVFGNGTASYDMFGDGRDGALVVAAGQTYLTDGRRAAVSGTASAGQQNVYYASTSGGVSTAYLNYWPKYDWFNTDLMVATGDRIVITKDEHGNPTLGKICYGSGDTLCYMADGISEAAPAGWNGPGLRKYSLIGRIGNGSPFYVGMSYDGYASGSGPLYLGLNDCTGCCGDNTRSWWFNHQVSVYPSATATFAPGDMALLIQMTGVSAGQYETATIASAGTGWVSLSTPLRGTYSTSGNSVAQIIRIPQFTNVTVQSQGTVSAHSWSGVTGGVVAFAVRDQLTVQAGGAVSAFAIGFNGGRETAWSQPDAGPAYQGASYTGASQQLTRAPNAGGGGGGQNAGGGGGGYGTPGQDGAYDYSGSTPGLAGSGYGVASLSTMFMGSGGGGSGHVYESAAQGGKGGGIALIVARTTSISGPVSVGGQGGWQGSYGGDYPAPTAPSGSTRNGGGGAGGSIRLVLGNGSLGTGVVTALGGLGGTSTDGGGRGGNGGTGRIRVDYCEAFSGSTSPAASSQRMDCYIAEQVDVLPYTSGRLNLPATFSNGTTYQIQYGRRHVFGGAGEQTSALRVPAGAFTDVRLDGLISEVGTGTRTFRLDIGNDGSWDWEWTGSVTNAIALNSANLSYAFSRYWATHGAPTSGTVDVPVRVYLSQAGQVLLNNLRTTLTGSKVRYARLPAQTYASVTLNLSVGTSGSSPLTVAADVGNNGTVDWTYTATSASYPLALTTSNLATAFNAYLSGRTGDVAVPIRFYVAPFYSLQLRNFSATVSARPDLTIGVSDVSFGAVAPTEGDSVPITVTLRNNGTLAATGHTAAFYATAPEWGEWYIGSAFVSGIPAGGTAEAAIAWDTMGFTGTVPVRVRLDPYNRLIETSDANNEATTTFRILTRPDLYASSVEFLDVEPMAGETVTVTLGLRNAGETSAGPTAVGFEVGDALLSSAPVATLAAGTETTTSFTWTPATPGPYRLRWTSDRADAVNEYDENNNVMWRDMYVGFPSPLLLDSGVPAADPAYLSGTGYGVVDTGMPDVLTTCGVGAAPYETLRRDPEGQLVYRFDHLLSGHFYHLDITLYECDGAGRQESVYVDGTLVAGPEDLGDGEVHQLSIRLDPALYRSDHGVEVVISAPGFDGAVVSEVNLHDIDYRYADAGAASDQSYVGSTAELPFGWLDGTALTTFGTLPYQSVRADQDDNELRYQFGGLDAAKSYNVHFTFWQPSGTARIERIRVDGLDTGVTVNTGDFVLHHETVSVPPAAYADDGTVVVSIVRLNARSGAMVNEVALEEETRTPTNLCQVAQTPQFTDVYGSVQVLSQDVPVGTVVKAYSPRGDVVGCFVVSTAGDYGFMRIYGEDATATPPIPGMRDGELVEFRVSGALATATPKLYWQNDHSTHLIDLNAGTIDGQLVSLNPGWNLISFYVDPPVPTVARVLTYLSGLYDRVLSRTGVYVPSLPAFSTLTELHAGQGYYLRLSSTTSVDAYIEGTLVPVGTPLILEQGWNWIGYLPRASMPVTTALQSIEGQYQLVLSLNQTYVPALPQYSTLTWMEPGKGYLIYMTNPAVLTYPETSGSSTATSADTESNGACPAVPPTPAFSIVYGSVTINGVAAAGGTVVEVVTPRGDVAGCGVVTTDGLLPLTHVYGEDTTADPPIPGFRDGELMAFHANGFQVAAEPTIWNDDSSYHEVALSGEIQVMYLPMVARYE